MHRPAWSRLAALGLLPFAAACGDPGPIRVVEVESPAGPSSGMPHLSGGRDGVYLSWLEGTPEGGHALRFSRWDGERWADRGTIASGVPFFVNWADFPSILPLRDGTLAAHWLSRSGEDTYAYDVVVSRSTDGGARWTPGLRPHRDGTQTEHGFVSMVELDPGRFAAVWLDGRKFAASGREPGEPANEMTLRFATFEDGAFGPETVLDPRICDCCQTAMVRTDRGLFVAYRDRSDAEVRDISYVRRVDGRWTAPQSLRADGWETPACPVNGPAAAADGDRLAVAWFTNAPPEGAPGTDPDARVLVTFSSDGGESFSEPIRADGGAPAGRVDVEWLADGGALVSWIERLAGGGAEIRARRIAPDGAPEGPVTVARTPSSRASGFPRLARREGDVWIAWTHPGEPSRVRVATLGARKDRRPPPQGRPPATGPLAALVDRPALDFSAAGLDGASHRLSGLEGRVVLLTFWGIWCPPCRQEIPELVALHEEMAGRGFEILAVNAGDPREIVPPFVAEHGIRYPVIFDEGVSDLYRVAAYPTHVVVDRDGKIRYTAEGYDPVGMAALRRVIEELLEPARARR